ncbi:aldose 1-epimerase family protein [Segetibacter sp. 3557_3]|uniref:aldose 1-epimerase family protein n=1 Tax=Segetibacter sp. 3557_3 TaxID=2547429 RepID=UPI001058A88F|nr:aldose 1-epimerase family protein [Segetibacter sp. 3557_3]TDH22975.1 aldose 1-epimerase family protein [Segetibacter sp. 3557_3]
MIQISNENLLVQVSPKGAELQSIANKETGLEYLWSGDPAFWPKKSPVLFPIVGGLKNNTYTFNDKSYNLGRHGFARDMAFTVTAQSSGQVTFTLESNEQSRLVYPFEFRFSITYTIIDNAVQVTYLVENKVTGNMYFSVGAHPAFRVPLVDGTSYEDYYLQFEKVENAGRFPLSPEGLIELTAEPYLSSTNQLPLKKSLFEKDALVFKNLQSNSITICTSKAEHGVRLSYEDFPYMGIWAAKGADFVCIEPWCGIADSVNASRKLEEKEGINTLASGQTFTRSYTINTW